jgi:hypothetical protein
MGTPSKVHAFEHSKRRGFRYGPLPIASELIASVR